MDVTTTALDNIENAVTEAKNKGITVLSLKLDTVLTLLKFTRRYLEFVEITKGDE